jgi:hypothetical protein
MPDLPTAASVLTAGTAYAVGTYDVGPFVLGGANGFILDMTRSDDGTNGTCTVALMVEDPQIAVVPGTSGLFSQLDGAGNAIDINDWAASENVRRTLQVHPTAGPMPTDDADGVFAVGTTGVASDYFRQPVQEPFWFRIVVATDASTFSRATLYFVR